MQGYDPQKAHAFILSRIDRASHPDFKSQIDGLIREAIDLDLQFMVKSGAVDADGLSGSAYYDDDEAFEHILEGLVKAHGYDDRQAVKLGSLVDDYMDAQQLFMEDSGLLDWE